MENEHEIAFKESFDIRRPVLEAMLPGNRWSETTDGERIKFDLPLNNYSKHERDVIEFTLNPYCMSENIFQGLHDPNAQLLAKAINEMFGPDGFYSK